MATLVAAVAPITTHRWIRGRLAPFLTVGFLVLSVGATSAVSTAAAESPASAAARLAKQVSTTRDPAAAGSAAAAALRWGGVGVLREGRPDEPLGLDSGLRVLGLQTVNFAHQARGGAPGAEVSVARLDRVLRDMRAPVGRPGASLARVLRVWVRVAKRKPRNVHSFSPLFVAAMVARRQDGLRLEDRSWKPRRVRLSGLEIELFVAALTRGIPSATSAGESNAAGSAAAGAPARFAAATPCSDALKALDVAQLGPFGEEMSGLPSLGKEVKRYLNEEMRKAFERASGGKITPEEYSYLLQALGVIAELMNTQALYQSLSVRVFPAEADSLHRPRNGNKALQHFAVIVGIDESLWRAYKAKQAQIPQALRDASNAIRDCLREAGIPKFEDLKELASQVDGFVARWHPLDAPNYLARINVRESQFDFLGTFRHRLRSISDHESSAVMAIDVLPVDESNETHDSGCRIAREITATAEINLSRPPKLSVFTSVLDFRGKGLTKLPKSIAVLAIDLYRGLDTPSASGTLSAFWHTSAALARTAQSGDKCERRDPPDDDGKPLFSGALNSTRRVAERGCTAYEDGTATWEEVQAKPIWNSLLIISSSLRSIAPSQELGYTGLLPLEGTVSRQYKSDSDSWDDSSAVDDGPRVFNRDGKTVVEIPLTGERRSVPKLKVGDTHTFPITKSTYMEQKEVCPGSLAEQTLYIRDETSGRFTVTRIANPRPPE